MRIRHWLAGIGALVIGVANLLTGRSEAQPAELSFTAAQTASGEAEYKTSCIDCHGAHLDDGEFGGPPLKGEAFAAKWFRSPPGILVNYIHAAMPPDAPGRLPLGTYVEIVAYILGANGFSPGTREMPADKDALAALRYPVRVK
ncbi:MAG TPA: cytochrome c [Rhizomicrobium sp.]|nr:cytochrome c [Rhizomicrobium sp.]